LLVIAMSVDVDGWYRQTVDGIVGRAVFLLCVIIPC